jgi:two-component system phosphate regulon response regulator PhoB
MSPRQVVLVEDDRAIRELLTLHLHNAGYEAVAFADALLAGRYFLQNARSVDLLIVDAHLPYMSGVEFVSTLIADITVPPVPIVLITGYEHLADRAEILGVPCLMKPFSADDLIGLVGKSIRVASPTESAAGLRDGLVPEHGRKGSA